MLRGYTPAMLTADGPVAIVGAGGHGRVVANTLRAAGIAIHGFYDDDESLVGGSVDDIPVVGTLATLAEEPPRPAVAGIGDNAARKQVVESLELDWVTAVHPFSWVDPTAELGPGTLVCAGAIVQAGARVGSHVILNTKSSVDHDTQVGDYVHVAMAHLAGGASADEGAFLALASTVLPGCQHGAWSLVAAGSLVRKYVAPGATVSGQPAR